MSAVLAHRKEIDGLRGLAVAIVVLYHYGLPWLPGGFIGVDVFFVISGYLITQIIVTERAQTTFSLRAFWLRRARRLLPALVLVLLATSLAAIWLMLPKELERYGEGLFASTTFASNAYFWLTTSYFHDAGTLNPLLHTWSLAVEEQFYLLYPLLIMLMAHMGLPLRWMLLAFMALSFANMLYLSDVSQRAAFYLPNARFWEILAGAVAALWSGRWSVQLPRLGWNILSGLGLALIAVSACVFKGGAGWPDARAAVPVLGAAILLVTGRNVRPGNGLLTIAPVVLVGQMSYSLYLWHQPVLAMAQLYWVQALSVAQIAAVLLGTLLMAYASWRWVETPWRRGRLSDRAFVIAGLFAVGSLALVGLMLRATGGLPQRYTDPLAVSALAAAGDYNPERDLCDAREDTVDPSKVCLLGDASKAPTIALWGDSQADSLARALSLSLRELGQTAVQLTKQGCPPVFGVTRVGLDCEAFNRSAVDYIVQHGINNVVVLGRYSLMLEGTRYENDRCRESRGAFERAISGDPTAEMVELARRLTARGARLFLIEPLPEMGCDVPAALVRGAVSGRSQTHLWPTRAEYATRNQQALELIGSMSAISGVTAIDAASVFCENEALRCMPNDAAAIYFHDDNHLTTAGAVRVVNELLDQMSRR